MLAADRHYVIPPMQLRTVKAGDGPLLKELTLRSVEEAPYAFGGPETLEEERKRPDAQWDELAAECAGDVEAWRDRCVGYFILNGETACAKALGYLSFKVPGLAKMSGVWVDPRHRRKGLGQKLVRETCRWAASTGANRLLLWVDDTLARPLGLAPEGANRLLLWVDDTNPGAARFYQALGFNPTGESRPVSPGSPLLESGYERPLPAA